MLRSREREGVSSSLLPGTYSVDRLSEERGIDAVQATGYKKGKKERHEEEDEEEERAETPASFAEGFPQVPGGESDGVLPSLQGMKGS
jgi:hypothetical protein